MTKAIGMFSASQAPPRANHLTITGALLVVALVTGCAAFGSSSKSNSSTVSDADFGRLTPSQTKPADDARAQLALARDELGRAKLGVVNDQHEGDLARNDQGAAAGDVSRAAIESKIGKDSNEPGQMEQARDDTRTAQQGKEAADARLAYSKRLASAQGAQVTAAERKVDLMTEKVNLAKLQSLEDAAIPIAGKYDRATATQRVVDAQGAFDRATATADAGLRRVRHGEGALAEARGTEEQLMETGRCRRSPGANEVVGAVGRRPASAGDFPIVGVGASAGGLDAFKQLLAHLPADSGLALVMVQHLEATRASLLSDALGRATGMKVAQAEQGVRVEPNHVYVIPPGARMAIEGGVLRLSPLEEDEHRPHLPIDFFLRSLAVERGRQAIGVILSGTASDGTAGLAAIRAHGGITFAQDPRSARFGEMPQSAVDAGVVDFCLPLPALGAELVRLARHPVPHPPRARTAHACWRRLAGRGVRGSCVRPPASTSASTSPRPSSGGSPGAWRCAR